MRCCSKKRWDCVQGLPLLEKEVVVGGEASHMCFEQGRGWWCVQIPSVTQIVSGRG